MYNRVILMGRLVADPELKTTQSGIAVCRFRIAVDRYAKQGEEKQADFFQVQAWRNTAEFVSRYFSKGRMIHIEGRLQNHNYEDQNGVKHYTMDVVADNVAFCGDKQQNVNAAVQQPYGGSNGNDQQNYTARTNPPPQAAQQTYRGGGYYQQNTAPPINQQAYTPPVYQQPNMAGQPIELGDLGGFEEILSDGDVPF